MAESQPSLLTGRNLLALAALVTVCVVGAVFFFLGPLSQSSAPPNAPDRPAAPATFAVPPDLVVGKPEEPVTWYQYAGRGTVTVRGVRWTTEGTQPPVKGNRYLVLDVEITATEGELVINPLYLSALDPDGNEAFLATMAGYQPELAQTRLLPGQTVRAYAAFDVPPKQTVVVFSEELFNPVLTINIPAPA